MSAYAALAEPHRRQILDLLRDGERPAGELVNRLDLSQPGVSKHLKVLREAGLVVVRADGKRRLYALRPAPSPRSTSGWSPTARSGPAASTLSNDTWRRTHERRNPGNDRRSSRAALRAHARSLGRTRVAGDQRPGRARAMVSGRRRLDAGDGRDLRGLRRDRRGDRAATHPIASLGRSAASGTASSWLLSRAAVGWSSRTSSTTARAQRRPQPAGTPTSRGSSRISPADTSPKSRNIEPWEEIHEGYAERFGVDPAPGRRFLAAQRSRA